MRLSFTFSLNHAVVVTAVSLSVTELGKHLGSYGSGTLYLAYTAVALLLSSGIVAALGAKRSMVAALALYCVYVASYLGAVFVRGDCEGVSVDSRVFGDVDERYLVGRPEFRVWPPGRVGPVS